MTYFTDMSMLLYYATYVLLALVCGVALVRALWAPWDLYRGACCGGCGHEVADIMQGQCPECGGMYAKVGVSTPSMAVRLRGSMALALLAWTTLMVTAGSFLNGLLEQRAWTAASTAMAAGGTGGGSTNFSADFQPWTFNHGGGIDPEAMNFRVSLKLSTVSDGVKVNSGTATMVLRKNGTANFCTLEITLPDGEYVLKDADGNEIESGKTVDKALIERWTAQLQLNPATNGMARAKQDLLKMASYAINDPDALTTMNQSLSSAQGDLGALQYIGRSFSAGGFAGGGFAAPTGPSTYALTLTGGILSTIYVVGCAGIVWRHRRLVRR